MTMSKLGVSGSASASVGSGGSASRAGAAKRSGSSGPGGWHPTVLYMLALIVAEVFAVAFLSRHLLR